MRILACGAFLACQTKRLVVAQGALGVLSLLRERTEIKNRGGASSACGILPPKPTCTAALIHRFQWWRKTGRRVWALHGWRPLGPGFACWLGTRCDGAGGRHGRAWFLRRADAICAGAGIFGGKCLRCGGACFLFPEGGKDRGGCASAGLAAAEPARGAQAQFLHDGPFILGRE